MQITQNPFRATGLTEGDLADIPFPASAADRPLALIRSCPRAGVTPLQVSDILADRIGIGQLFVKDERPRMGLGSFKALGAAYVVAREAEAGRARGQTFVTASAGNHGLSLAAGAAAFGARARIYLAETVPEGFAHRLRDLGAEVVRAGAIYEDSMAAAADAARSDGLTLLSDSSWPGYTDLPHQLMEGYLVLMAEAVDQIPAPPSHIFVQAGVGGLAAAVAAHARLAWGDTPMICVVEPEAAPALAGSIATGGPVTAEGPVSSMGRLDCKDPSYIALKGLSRDADLFLTITEDEAQTGTGIAAGDDLASTPSGAAGLAALLASAPHRDALHLEESSKALTFLTEVADP